MTTSIKPLNLGILQETPPGLARKIRISNLIGCFGAVGSFIYVIFQLTRLIPYSQIELLVSGGVTLAFLFVLILNAYHKYLGAMLFLCLDMTLIISVLDLGYGEYSGLKYLLVGNILLPSLLFDRWYMRVAFTVLIIVAFFAVYFVNPFIPNFFVYEEAGEVQHVIIYTFNHVLVFTMLVLTFNQFRKDLEHYQELIEQKNQDLEEASEEIRAQRDDLQEANQEIQNKSEEILSQRDMLEQTSRSLLETNRNLTDSINYAKRIQDGLSPMREVMNKSLPEHFVLLLPRDVVSGDAVYYREMEGYYVMASVDCTGHGVPGSLMTMMMYTIMDQLVVDFQWRNPAEILERLHINLRRALGNAGGKQTDGMDMAIVIQDEDDSTIHYSGAKHPLFYWSKEEGLQYQKGTPRSVGDPRSQHIPFQAHSFKMKPNTSIYLFSDGYADQFGGPNGRKFMRKRFRKLIEESGHLPMLEQKEVLHNSILKWTNQWSYSQVDDILVIGAKVT